MKIKKNLLFAAVLLLAACNSDIEEFKFTGHVVGGELCSSSQTGYVIDILTPDSIGATYTSAGGKFDHAVMAYKAPRRLKADDTISGVAYFTESYAALNCFGIIDNGLPEIILLSVDEDK